MGLDEGAEGLLDFDEGGKAGDFLDIPVEFTGLEDAGLLTDPLDVLPVDLVLHQKTHFPCFIY